MWDDWESIRGNDNTENQDCGTYWNVTEGLSGSDPPEWFFVEGRGSAELRNYKGFCVHDSEPEVANDSAYPDGYRVYGGSGEFGE